MEFRITLTFNTDYPTITEKRAKTWTYYGIDPKVAAKVGAGVAEALEQITDQIAFRSMKFPDPSLTDAERAQLLAATKWHEDILVNYDDKNDNRVCDVVGVLEADLPAVSIT